MGTKSRNSNKLSNSYILASSELVILYYRGVIHEVAVLLAGDVGFSVSGVEWFVLCGLYSLKSRLPGLIAHSGD